MRLPWYSSFEARPRAPLNMRSFDQLSRSSSCRRLAGLNLVLRLGVEIAGVVAFVQLVRGLARGAVDHATALHRRALGDGVGPALHVLVVLHCQEFAAAIEQALG